MSPTLVMESQDFALKLREFLEDFDTARWKTELEAVTRERLATLERDLNRLLEASPNKAEVREAMKEKWQKVEARLAELSTVLRSSPNPKVKEETAPREQWKEFRARLQSVYEDIASELRTLDIHVPSLRPTNYARNVFHVISALSVLILIQYILNPTGMIIAAAAFALAGWGMETARRYSTQANTLIMKAFTPVAHPHEYHRVNSATWYVSALLILSLTGSALMCSVAVIVLGFADPAAALIGRRFGRISLINGRSLEGTLTFIVTGFIGALGVIQLWHPEISLSHACLMGAVAAVFGGIAELVSSKVDDNMTIPLASGAGCALIALLCEIPL